MAQDSEPRRQSPGALQTKQFCSCTPGQWVLVWGERPSPLPAPLAQPREPVGAPRGRAGPSKVQTHPSEQCPCVSLPVHPGLHALQPDRAQLGARLQQGSAAPAQTRWASTQKLAFWSLAACVQRAERGEEARILLQSCRLSSPCAAAALPSLARCRRDVTCASAAFRPPLSLPLLLARCLLGAHNKQQIDGDCTGICLKVHGTHQRMAGAPVLPPLRPAAASAAQPWHGERAPAQRSPGPASCTIGALPKPTLMKRLQVTFERKSQEGSVS